MLSLSAALTLLAGYTLHNVKGNVTVSQCGRSLNASKGMKLNAGDKLIIPENASVEILNDLDGKVYTSVKCGEFSVNRVLLDARSRASDRRRSVDSELRFQKKGGDSDARVYKEVGMVKRSMTTYDPEAVNMQMDPETLSKWLATAIRSTISPADGNASGCGPAIKPVPVALSYESNDSIGLGFRLFNTLDFPVYFNVLKIVSAPSTGVEISELGQPAGSYSVLPGQSLSRENFRALKEGEQHFLLLSHCLFDLDSVLENVNTLLAGSSDTGPVPNDMPIYIQMFAR